MTDEPLNLELITSSKEPIQALLKLVNAEYPSLQAVVLSILERVAGTESGMHMLDSLNAFSVLEQVMKSCVATQIAITLSRFLLYP
jgi:hypothetical protein